MRDLEARLADMERRLADLEKNSHPPVDMTVPVYQAMARLLRTAADQADPPC